MLRRIEGLQYGNPKFHFRLLILINLLWNSSRRLCLVQAAKGNFLTAGNMKLFKALVCLYNVYLTDFCLYDDLNWYTLQWFFFLEYILWWLNLVLPAFQIWFTFFEWNYSSLWLCPKSNFFNFNQLYIKYILTSTTKVREVWLRVKLKWLIIWNTGSRSLGGL